MAPRRMCGRAKRIMMNVLCLYGVYSLMTLVYFNTTTQDDSVVKRFSDFLPKNGAIALTRLGEKSNQLVNVTATVHATADVITARRLLLPLPQTQKTTHTSVPVKLNSKWKKVPWEREFLEFLTSMDCVCPPPVKAYEYKTVLSSELCTKQKPYLVTFVHTAVTNRNRRDVIRNTWGSLTSWKDRAVVTVFMLGVSRKESENEAVRKESATFGDIVQGDFVDAYRNMTYKHLMGLGWISENCPSAHYVMKTDDDPFINIFELLRQLEKRPLPEESIFCHMLKNPHVTRIRNKWYTSYWEYGLPVYPNYCEGLAFVMTMTATRRLFEASKTSRFYWVDDVYVTGFLRVKAQIDLVGFNRGVFTPKLVDPRHKKGLLGFFVFRGINVPVNVYERAWNIIVSEANATGLI